VIDELIEAVTKLSEVSDRLEQAGNARRKQIAEYFATIEDCLRQSIDQLKNGQTPNNKWAEFRVYARKLSTTIGKEIGRERAEEISLLLLSTARHLPTDQDISSIEKVAGEFRGLVNTIATKEAGKSTRRQAITNVVYGLAGAAVGVSADKILKSLLPHEPSPIFKPSSTNNISGSDAFPSINWEMHTFLSDSFKGTILYGAPARVCKLVSEMTDGRFKINLTRTGETTEAILSKVRKGQIQSGYTGIYYNTDTYRVLFFGCAIPFGLSPQEQTAWLNYKKNSDDEFTFIQSIYTKKLNLNIIPFPAGATGGQMGGWWKEKINSLDDLKRDYRGQKKVIRIPGLGGDVFVNLGMTTHDRVGQAAASLKESVGSLKNDIFFAVEWTSPYDDLQLGLNEAAKFYYYPGWWEPSTTFDVNVNMDAWNKLPSNYQKIFKLACSETYTTILSDYDQKNSLALEQILSKGVELIKFNDDVMKAAEKETKALLDLYATQDPTGVFKEVYDEWMSFKNRIRKWSNLTKY